MKYLYFVRHAQQQENGRYWIDAGLTPSGFRQADLVGRKLKELGCTKILSSELKRARLTSEVINQHLCKKKILYLSELREIDYGEWEGMLLSDVANQYPEENCKIFEQFVDIPYPGGESGYDVFVRAKKTIKRIIESEVDEHIAVVTHGEVILSLLCANLKIDFGRRFNIAWLDHCGITLIVYNNSSTYGIIRYINDTKHLQV